LIIDGSNLSAQFAGAATPISFILRIRGGLRADFIQEGI
jgi:hypothetical protein